MSGRASYMQILQALSFLTYGNYLTIICFFGVFVNIE